MRGKVSSLIDSASGDGRSQPFIGEEKVYPAFAGSIFCLASGLPWPSIAYAAHHPYVRPSMLFRQSVDGWERIGCSIEVSGNEFRAWFHGFEEHLDDGEEVIGSGNFR